MKYSQMYTERDQKCQFGLKQNLVVTVYSTLLCMYKYVILFALKTADNVTKTMRMLQWGKSPCVVVILDGRITSNNDKTFHVWNRG